MKANADLATMIGWNAEWFARQKRLTPLTKYLEPTKPKTAEAGAREVKRMFDKLIAKQNKGQTDGNG